MNNLFYLKYTSNYIFVPLTMTH